MTGDEQDSSLRRRSFLATGSGLLASALAGCTVSMDLPFGGDGEKSSTTPTAVTRTRTVDSTPTQTPAGTATSTQTSPETTKPAQTAVGTATPSTNESDEKALDVPPAAEIPPCVVDGSCMGPPTDRNVTIDPSLVGKLNYSLVDPSVFDTNFDFPSDSVEGGPSATTDGGDVTVEVTPEQKATKTKNESGASDEERDGMVCTVRKQTATTGGADVFLMNPSTTTIYPGAVLTAASIAEGSFAPAFTSQRRDGASVDAVRNPLELSISLANVDGKNTTTVQTPSVGAVRTARTEILRRVGAGRTPAAMSYEKRRIYSKEQLSVELGAHYNSPTVDVEGNYDFSRTTETNKLLAKFWQKYYDISVSLPNPVGNGVVTDSRYVHQNDVVVNNVSYGRLLVFSAESKYTHQEVETALDVAVKAGVKDGGVSLSTKDEQVLKNTKVKINVLGGNASAASKLISGYGETGAETQIGNWIERGATYDPADSPGVPVAYQTKYLNGLKTANVYLTTTYNKRNCRPKTRRFRVHNFHLKVVSASDVAGSKSTEEMYGTIFVGGRTFTKGRSNPAPSVATPQWDHDSDEWIRIQEGRKKSLGIDKTVEFSTDGELDRRRSYIEVTMRPREHDGGPDEFTGESKDFRWFLSENPSDPSTTDTQRGDFKETFADSGTEIEITFDITPLPPA